MKYKLIIALNFLLITFCSYGGGGIPVVLKIAVVNELGNPEPEATVKLYTSKSDYLTDTKSIKTKVSKTNKRGMITFKSLSSHTYYIRVEKGKRNNNGKGVKTPKFDKKLFYKMIIVISPE